MTDNIWSKVQKAFPVLLNETDLEQNVITEDDFTSLASELNRISLCKRISELVLVSIETYLRKNIVPYFWSKFISSHKETDKFKNFHQAVKELYETTEIFKPMLEKLTILNENSSVPFLLYGENSISSAFHLILRATLLAQLPVDYEVIIYGFYDIAFKVFANTYDAEHDESVEDIVQCGGCGMDIEQCCCQHIVEVFHQVNHYLNSMGLLERLASQVLTSLIQERISTHVQNTCSGSFDVSHIKGLGKWLDTVVLSWLVKIYNPVTHGIETSKGQETVAKFKQKVVYFLYETYTTTRIGELFNIIIGADFLCMFHRISLKINNPYCQTLSVGSNFCQTLQKYPDSHAALDDLRICLPNTELRPHLIRTLQDALETRLLHPGANTPDILTAYISAIKALRILDSTGVLLETITEPVRLYLRSREDTVRCVVTNLIEDGTSDLAEELARSEAHKMEEGNEITDEIDNWETWSPDPIDANPSKLSNGRRTSDIISMLVDVYGSKELFVNEYRTLLADRLLTNVNFNPEKEIRNLELLKLRFGETQLHNCEVMLKDVTDSKRINAHIQSDKEYNDAQIFPTAATIVSAQFWPPFKEETLELPPEIKQQMERYTKSFEAHKGSRTLCWKPHLGHVNLDIELTNRKLSLTVTPIHATIIIHFQEKEQWSLEELSKVMKVPPSVLRRKISFWQSQGLLRELSQDCFLLVESSCERESHSRSQDVCEEDETESAMASTSDQREGELQVFWSYIVGMLTNLDSLPLERIHQMLKMFASQGPAVECSTQELRHFLDRKVREHKLLFIGGLYKLPKM